jgi:hypothetical protein
MAGLDLSSDAKGPDVPVKPVKKLAITESPPDGESKAIRPERFAG